MGIFQDGNALTRFTLNLENIAGYLEDERVNEAVNSIHYRRERFASS